MPYRALLPKQVDNLLVIGKATAGGTHLRTAHGVLFQGQAAGTAAAQALRNGTNFRTLDIGKLQQTLKNDGVELVLETTVTIKVRALLQGNESEKATLQMKRYNEDHIKHIIYGDICERLYQKKHELMRDAYRNPINPVDNIQDAFDEIIEEIEG